MRVLNLRVCKHLNSRSGTRREEGRINVLPLYRPSSRRGKNLQLDVRRKNRAAREGKWSPRGTGMTVLTHPGIAPVTGKAGENGQYSGEIGGSSPGQDRRLLQRASARSRVGIVIEDGSGSLSTASPAGRFC